MAGQDPEARGDAARPGRIAWVSIFASGLVVGLMLGLGLSPQGLVGAARQIGQAANLWTPPTDQPMAPAALAPASALPGLGNAAETPPTVDHPSAAPGPSLYAASVAADAAQSDAPFTPAPQAAAAPSPAPTTPAPLSAGTAQAAAVSTPVFAAAPTGEHPVTVGVFGDSLADGLWAGLYRQMRDGKRIEVIKFSQPATGLSRYDYVNVQTKTQEQLAKRHVDVAVMLFGTNDQQGIVEGGRVYPFGSPGWRQAYGARIDALVALLRRQGATVYWVGLPKMRSDGFDQKARLINAVYQQHMAALGVRFIPTDGATADPRGAYAAYLPDGPSGKMTLMRANDGVHMSMPGYLRIAAPVSSSIRADLSQHAGAAVSAAEGLGR